MKGNERLRNLFACLILSIPFNFLLHGYVLGDRYSDLSFPDPGYSNSDGFQLDGFASIILLIGGGYVLFKILRSFGVSDGASVWISTAIAFCIVMSIFV